MNGPRIKRLGVVVLVAGLVLAGAGTIGFESASVERGTSAGIAADDTNASLAVELEATEFNETVNETFHLLDVTNNLESEVEVLKVAVEQDPVQLTESPVVVEDRNRTPLNETDTTEVWAECRRQTVNDDFVVEVTGEARSSAVVVERGVSIRCSEGDPSL